MKTKTDDEILLDYSILFFKRNKTFVQPYILKETLGFQFYLFNIRFYETIGLIKEEIENIKNLFGK